MRQLGKMREPNVNTIRKATNAYICEAGNSEYLAFLSKIKILQQLNDY